MPWTEVVAAAGIEDDSEPSRMLLSALKPSVSSQMQMDVPDGLNITRSLLLKLQKAAKGQGATPAHGPAAPTLKHTSKPRGEGEKKESAQAGPSQQKRKQKPEPKPSQETVNPPPPPGPSSQTQAPQPTETTAAAVSPTADNAAAATPATSAIDHASQVPAAFADAETVVSAIDHASQLSAASVDAETVVRGPLPKPSKPEAGSPATPGTPQEPSEAEIALAEMRKRLAATGGHRFQEVTEDVGNARKRQKLGSPRSPTQPPQSSQRLPSNILDDDREDEAAGLEAALTKSGEGKGGGDEEINPSNSGSSGEDEDSDDDDSNDDDEKPDSYENGDSPDRDAVLASAF